MRYYILDDVHIVSGPLTAAVARTRVRESIPGRGWRTIRQSQVPVEWLASYLCRRAQERASEG